jgi:hypothetical protein
VRRSKVCCCNVCGWSRGKRLIGGIAQCKEAQSGAPFQTFNLEDMGPDPLNGKFELLCAA